MRTTRRPASDDIDLGALWTLAVRSLPRLAVLALVAGAATYGVLSLVAPRYMSETQISIESKSTNNPYADPNRTGGASDSVSVRMDKEAVNTHVRALQSYDLAETIVREMKLADKVEFNSTLGAPDTLSALLRLVGIGKPRPGESVQELVISAYFAHLDVYPAKESRVIGIRFSSSDPVLAAAVANRIAETYRENLARQSITETDDVQKALAPQIAKLADEAASAEADVERFRGEANIFKGGQQSTGLNEQQLAELNAELSRAKAARSEAEARAKQAREMLTAGGADALPDVQKSPVIQNLVQSRVRVERQISELSATLLPGHPRMRQLNADLAGLKKQISAEVAKIVEGLSKEAKVTAMREEAVAKSVSEIKTRIVDTGPDEAKLRNLEANARSKRAELDRLRAQYEGNRVRADDSRTIPVEAQIVSMARPSSVPVFPKKTATTLLVAVATLMFGMAIVITRGLLSGVRVPVAVEREPMRRTMPVAPVLPGLHRVPDLAAAAEPPQGAAMHAFDSPAAIADRLRAMRAQALSGTRSLIAGDITAGQLAVEAASLGKALAAKGQTVILIDWAPAGGGIAEALGRASVPGMLDLVAGRVKFEDVVGALGQSGAHLIPAGSSLAAGEIIDPNHVNFVLDALDGVYDQIIVASREEAARHLFEAIEGRFDCGITVVSAEGAPLLVDAQTFLGYEVDGIELMRYAVPASFGKASGRAAHLTRQEPRMRVG
jgi:succinoglycan biosynthesis transport protein ExoP